MRRPSVFYKSLRDLRWQVFWYGIGLALMAALVVYIYPSYTAQLADFEVPEALQGFIGEVDYTTGEGFVSAEVFSWFPIALVVFAVMSGTSALAGEEAEGTLELVLAQPLSRRRLLLEKLAGLVLATLGICALIYLGWLISVPFVDIELGYGQLAVATLNLVPIVVFFQVLSLWAGVTLPGRGLATGAVVAFAIVTYFVNYLASIVDVLDPLRWVSAFHYYHGIEILVDGVFWPGVAVLIALCAFFAAWALYSFERRDIGVYAGGFTLRLWARARQPQLEAGD